MHSSEYNTVSDFTNLNFYNANSPCKSCSEFALINDQVYVNFKNTQLRNLALEIRTFYSAEKRLATVV